MKRKFFLVCLLLSLLLILPAWADETPAVLSAETTYDKAVAELRNSLHYNSSSEETYETDDCTIFVYDQGGVMRAPHNRIAIIYKAGSLPGEGTCIHGEYPYPMFVYPGPDRIELREDGKTFTYAFLLEEDVKEWRDEEGNPSPLKAGTYTYTVDLPTGTTIPSYAPFSLEEMADILVNENGYTLEERLDGSWGSAILRWETSPYQDEEGIYPRSYELHLVSDKGELRSQKLLLPSTINSNTAFSPTHLPPDSMGFSENGESFTYSYTFDSELKREDTVLHEAGTYTYTVALDTGELEVIHTNPAPEGSAAFTDVPTGSWYEQGVRTCAEKGIMVGTGDGQFSPEGVLSNEECLVLALRLYDLQRGGSGQLLKAPEDWGKITLTIEGEEPISGYSGLFLCAPYHYGTSTASRPDLKVILPLAAQEEIDRAETLSGKSATLTAGGASTPGTVELSYIPARGNALFFLPDKDGELQGENNAQIYCSGSHPGPDCWWRDGLYTHSVIQDQAQTSLFTELFFALQDKTLAPATRHRFARSLAQAAGTLDKQFSVGPLPDLERADNEDIYTLYEAGILTGTDSSGTFQADKTLTRAEAAVMVARVLDPALRLDGKEEPQPTTSPVTNITSSEMEINRDFATYEEALTDQRRGFGYHNERLFDTDICTVVVNDFGGMPLPQKGIITVIYKAGSAQGDGTVLKRLPHPGNDYSPLLSRNPDSMELSADGKTFTYSYHFEEPLFSVEGLMLRAAGDFTYTVDLTTGEVTQTLPQVPPEVNTYEAVLERTLARYAEDGGVVEQTVEAPLCTLLFHYHLAENGARSYLLELVYKSDVDTDMSGTLWHIPEGSVKYIGLPITYNDDGLYTARMPDRMALSEDGNTFTLTYDQSYYGSPYTQTIDLRTGLYEGE